MKLVSKKDREEAHDLFLATVKVYLGVSLPIVVCDHQSCMFLPAGWHNSEAGTHVRFLGGDEWIIMRGLDEEFPLTFTECIEIVSRRFTHGG